jgi:hypothetical protein
MNGSICMFEVLLNVCYAFASKMMIQTNGVFVLIRGSNSMELIGCMDMF